MNSSADETAAPVLSAILPAPEDLAFLERTVVALGAQRIADQMELVIVAGRPDQPLPTRWCAWFRSVQLVDRRQWTTMTDARAAGVWQARAPIVVFCEDHSFPAPGWAEALLAGHEGPWAAVGPAMDNANPETRTSWANHAIEYGPWLPPVRPGAWRHIPGHNSSYKRAVLTDYGNRLPEMLEAESVLHWDLGRRGLQVAMAPAARTRHLGFSRLIPSVTLRFCGGRLFAASRSASWPSWRRAVYTVGAAALPALRTWRAMRDLRRVEDSRPRRGLGALTFLLLIADALGEAVGYAAGAGDQARRLSAIEHNRERFMSSRDQIAVRQ